MAGWTGVVTTLSQLLSALPLCLLSPHPFTLSLSLSLSPTPIRIFVGYYILEECGMDVLNPTIAMEIGETYTFIQEHRTNYFHRKYRRICGRPSSF